MQFLSQIQVGILLILQVTAVLMEFVALAHAVRTREDYFRAADRQTRPIWLGILGVALALGVVCIGRGGFFFVLPVVAAGIYLADVKPRIDNLRQ